ncbi:MAG: hypothetical protein GMKNLPBB_01438 [Myxococcota bacterium]|nr:hypothetical protein [Myxococcota bacterium]
MSHYVDNQRIEQVAAELLPIWTAPYCEERVMQYIAAFGEKLRLPVEHDRHGNIIITCRKGKPKGRIAFAAHMDHPGFEVEGVWEDRVHARWGGGVPPEYFQGAKVAFHAGKHTVRGVITEVTMRPDGKRVDKVTISVDGWARTGDTGMWDVTVYERQGDLIVSRVVDDLAGCAAQLLALEYLSKQRAAAEMWAIFTRAEEVGFVGAAQLVKTRRLPKKLPIVSIESSMALPNAEIGKGPVVRLGDRMTMFNQAVIDLLEQSAQQLAKEDPSFAWQRRVMDGGACEATLFNSFGYKAGGISLPLGNYHNVDREKKTIAPEYIHFNDLARCVDLVIRASLNAAQSEVSLDRLKASLLEGVEEKAANLTRRRARSHWKDLA